MGGCRIVLLAILTVESLAQVTLLNQPQDATVRRGGDATFHCVATENGTALMFVWYFTSVGGSRMSVGTGTPVAGVSRITVSGDRTQLTLSGVQREVDRATVVCSAIGSTVNVDSDPATLTVHYPPIYTFLPITPSTVHVLEGDEFVFSLVLDANPTPTNFNWSRNGQVISTGGRITTSVSTINITSTSRSDSGWYGVASENMVGTAAISFPLDVQFPPLIISRASQNVLSRGKVFTFNCTSEPANPVTVDYTFQKDGQPVDGSRATVQGPVLTITSVQARDGGNYSCSARNSVGEDTAYNSFIVSPSPPGAVTVSNLGPFSATVSWQPPLEDGGAVGPIMYTVTLTNTSDSTTFKFNPIAALTMNLAKLSHSVTYQVRVVAGNEAGMGPEAEVMFTTNDTVPTVSGVEALALTLDTVQVKVTVSDDGGQPVLEYTVIIGNKEKQVSAGPVAQVTGFSLAAGVTYGIGVLARNSIGQSKTFVGTFSVPAFSSAPSYYELKAMVIAFGVTLIILSLLLVLAIATAALLYSSKRKLKKSPLVDHIDNAYSVQYDEVQPRAFPWPSHTQPLTLPPVEERERDGSSSHVVLEDNPAYQPLDVQTTTKTDESLYL